MLRKPAVRVMQALTAVVLAASLLGWCGRELAGSSDPYAGANREHAGHHGAIVLVTLMLAALAHLLQRRARDAWSLLVASAPLSFFLAATILDLTVQHHARRQSREALARKLDAFSRDYACEPDELGEAEAFITHDRERNVLVYVEYAQASSGRSWARAAPVGKLSGDALEWFYGPAETPTASPYAACRDAHGRNLFDAYRGIGTRSPDEADYALERYRFP